MHRRQYLPGSQNKLSRTKLAEQNKSLIAHINRTVEQQALIAEARRNAEAAERAKANSGIRGFINKAKRALTKPLNLGRKRA